MPSFSGLLIISDGRLRRAIPARPVPARARAGGGARDRRPGSSSAPRARVGRDRRHDRRRGHARPGLPAVSGRPGNRPRPAARAGAQAHRARLRAVVRAGAAHPRARWTRPACSTRRCCVAIALSATSLARADPGPQGRRRERLDARPARDRGGVDRRLRRDHPAVDLLHRRGRDGRDAAADRRAVRAGRRDPRRRARRRALSPGSAPTCCACRTPPRRSACARAMVLLRGLRGDRRVARAGSHPGRVRGRRDPDPAGRRPGDDAPGLPAQARGDRLRLLHPGVLRHHRRALRSRRAARGRVDAGDGAAVRRRAAGRPRPAGAAVPRAASARAGRQSPGCYGDLAAVHRHRDRDRAGTRRTTRRPAPR